MRMAERGAACFFLALFLLALVANSVSNSIVAWTNKDRITRLQREIECLKHPHGESSIAGVIKTVNGKRTFVVTQPAHRTGC